MSTNSPNEFQSLRRNVGRVKKTEYSQEVTAKNAPTPYKMDKGGAMRRSMRPFAVVRVERRGTVCMRRRGSSGNPHFFRMTSMVAKQEPLLVF